MNTREPMAGLILKSGKKIPCVFPVCIRTFLIQSKIPQHTCTRIKYCTHVHHRNKYGEAEKYISYNKYTHTHYIMFHKYLE